MKLVLLANGPSLATHDLSKITLPVMGLNRSWKVYPEPAFHVVLEGDHYRANPEYHHRIAKKGGLFVTGENWKCGKVYKNLSGPGFSKDLSEGIVTEMHGVGSVFYAALQVAYALGFRTIYALGLDLSGDHFDGSPASAHVARQNLMFRFIPEDLVVLTCGSQSSLAIFEKVPFEVVTE